MKSIRRQNVVPLGLAVQGALLFVAAAMLNPNDSREQVVEKAAGGNAIESAELTLISELPRDLQRESLPVPRLPERETRNEPPQPKPNDEAPKAPTPEPEPKLASLRVQNVAFATPVPHSIAAPMPSAPSSLEGRSLAGGSWLRGRSRGRRGGFGPTPSPIGGGGIGGGGIGGRGIGGGGGGAGNCPGGGARR